MDYYNFLCSLGYLSYCITTTPTLIPSEYLAQSKLPDGNISTPLRDTDEMTYRRMDYGGYQIEDSFLTSDGGAITTWSYYPWGIFNQSNETGCPGSKPCNGFGGEKEIIENQTAKIIATQDGGTNGVQHFQQPWIIVAPVNHCLNGWTILSPRDWGCHMTITFPQGYGMPTNSAPWPYAADWASITADTIITEHGDDNAKERIFMVKGWGRLVWQSFNKTGAQAPLWRCPDFGWNNSFNSMILTDCRENLNIVYDNSKLSGQYEWKP